jgi:hypothetical protein
MTPPQIFQLASSLALIGWVLLATATVVNGVAPRRRLLLAGGRVVPMCLCAVYVAVLAAHWGSTPGGNFNSLAGVAILFSSPGKLLGGWVHYLAFDLFIGRWMIDDVLASRRSRGLLLPCLPLTFLFGPAGLLLHFALSLTARAKSLPA